MNDRINWNWVFLNQVFHEYYHILQLISRNIIKFYEISSYKFKSLKTNDFNVTTADTANSALNSLFKTIKTW